MIVAGTGRPHCNWTIPFSSHANRIRSLNSDVKQVRREMGNRRSMPRSNRRMVLLPCGKTALPMTSFESPFRAPASGRKRAGRGRGMRAMRSGSSAVEMNRRSPEHQLPCRPASYVNELVDVAPAGPTPEVVEIQRGVPKVAVRVSIVAHLEILGRTRKVVVSDLSRYANDESIVGPHFD